MLIFKLLLLPVNSGIMMSGAPAAAAAAAGSPTAQESQPSEEASQEESGPLGLRALCSACARLYPDQPNPLQVTARVKYWLGGPDPLDYVSMYWNSGRADLGVPPHWHYVSMGVSDLHGDGRVHPPPDRVLLAAAECPPPAGYGLEMTFRLAAPPPPAPPPVWPAALLQSLARYIFTTGVRLCVHDHISWHAPLDGAESRLRHLLVTEDPQLQTLHGPLGTVQFVQLVGATPRELRAAQLGAAADVLRALASTADSGGAWLVTDVSRRTSCASARVAISRQPADLAGVSTHLRWTEWSTQDAELAVAEAERTEGGASPARPPCAEGEAQMCSESAERRAGRGGETQLSTDSLKQIFTGGASGGDAQQAMSVSSDSLRMRSVAAALAEAELEARALPGVHVVLNAEAGALLPLALRGRVLHRRHFTWKCASSGRAVTLVAAGVSGALVTARSPYVATRHGWLQVLVPAWLARDMLHRAAPLESATDSECDQDGECEQDGELVRRGAGLELSYPRVGLRLTVLPPDSALY